MPFLRRRIYADHKVTGLGITEDDQAPCHFLLLLSFQDNFGFLGTIEADIELGNDFVVCEVTKKGKG